MGRKILLTHSLIQIKKWPSLALNNSENGGQLNKMQYTKQNVPKYM